MRYSAQREPAGPTESLLLEIGLADARVNRCALLLGLSLRRPALGLEAGELLLAGLTRRRRLLLRAAPRRSVASPLHALRVCKLRTRPLRAGIAHEQATGASSAVAAVDHHPAVPRRGHALCIASVGHTTKGIPMSTTTTRPMRPATRASSCACSPTRRRSRGRWRRSPPAIGRAAMSSSPSVRSRVCSRATSTTSRKSSRPS